MQSNVFDKFIRNVPTTFLLYLANTNTIHRFLKNHLKYLQVYNFEFLSISFFLYKGVTRAALLFLKNLILRLREMRNALQLPVFFFFFLFFSFFGQPCLGLRDCKSVFLILKISQYADPRE